MTRSQLVKIANAAPKFIVQLFDGVFLKDITGEMTDNKDEAIQYSIGFDDLKIRYWSVVFGCDAKPINL